MYPWIGWEVCNRRGGVQLRLQFREDEAGAEA
jgi:hypothetical protein